MHLPNRLAACLLVAASLFISPPRVLAQEDRAVFRTETRLVLLHATVVDKTGHLVTNLGRAAFKVYENGAEQELRIFRREDVPLSLALVVDNSGSMRDKRQKVEAAAVALVKASNPQDEVMIVNFNDEAYEDVQFTNDIKRMEEGLTRIDSRGGTAMRDAIAMTIDRVRERAKKDKKVLLVITDGNDNTSALSLEKLIQKAHESEVVHYAIGLLSEEERREAQRAKRALGTLTTATGGLVYYPKDLAEVEKIALQVAHEIR
ncbi:MAG: VWA domain-containing protein, partial [Acidobacteriota bacterium]